MCKAHSDWGDEVQSMVQQLPELDHEAIDWDPERCLTVGYVSPDLFTHSVSYFAEAPLTHHNTTRCVALHDLLCTSESDMSIDHGRADRSAA